VALYDRVAPIAGSRPIFVEGASFGTAVALSVAARRPVAGVILKNPTPLRELILGAYGWWNLWLLASPVAARIPADLDAVATPLDARCRRSFFLRAPTSRFRQSISAWSSTPTPAPKHLIEMPRRRARLAALARSRRGAECGNGLDVEVGRAERA